MPFTKGNTIGQETRFKKVRSPTPQVERPTNYDVSSRGLGSVGDEVTDTIVVSGGREDD